MYVSFDTCSIQPQVVSAYQALPDWAGSSVGMAGYRGMGCPGCGGRCQGLGRTRGLGLFDSMDFTTWGVGEWAVIGLGLFVLYSVFSTTKRGVKSAGRKIRSRATRKRRKEQLRRRIAEEQGELRGL